MVQITQDTLDTMTRRIVEALHRIKHVRSGGGYRFRLTFDDDTTGVIDFEPVVREGGAYSPLADEAVFRQFRLERSGRVLAWPNEIEFCADALWRDTTCGAEGASQAPVKEATKS